MKKSWIIFLQILNIIGYIVMLTVNSLANIVRINGKGTGEISDLYPNLFVPAGITFAIWGVIYLLLLLFTIYQAQDLFTKENKTGNLHQKVGILFLVTCAANASWIFAWHYMHLLASFLIMLILLAALIILYNRLNIGIHSDSKAWKYMVQLPFSVYLGWISIAAIANLTALSVKYSWLIPDVCWAGTAIIIGMLLALFMLIRKADVPYSLVVLWAFAGIVIKRSLDPSSHSQIIMMIAIVCMVPIAILAVIRFQKYLKI